MSVINGAKHDSSNKAKKIQRVGSVFEFVELIAISLGIIFFISIFFVRHSLVVGGSMDKTLANGDHLLISSFMYSPEVGDIVVCQVSDEQQEARPRELSPKEAIVKRIVALGGDRVRIENGTVFVNDVAIVEDYKYSDGLDWASDMDEITVSDGCVFVLGDHRNNSLDSRYIGEIDERLILGKAVLRIAPLSRFGSLYDKE